MGATLLDPRLYTHSPFSFVPLCAFKGKLSPSGKNDPRMEAPACSSFNSVLINGKLCHRVSINVSAPEPGQKNGLFLIVDPMISTPLDLEIEKGAFEENEVVSEGPTLQSMAEVHLATLSPYASGKNGTHILNALKKVTATKGFLAQSEESKDCGNDAFEVCQARRYLAAVQKQCGCLPWLATFSLEHKVTTSDLQSSCLTFVPLHLKFQKLHAP